MKYKKPGEMFNAFQAKKMKTKKNKFSLSSTIGNFLKGGSPNTSKNSNTSTYSPQAQGSIKSGLKSGNVRFENSPTGGEYIYSGDKSFGGVKMKKGKSKKNKSIKRKSDKKRKTYSGNIGKASTIKAPVKLMTPKSPVSSKPATPVKIPAIKAATPKIPKTNFGSMENNGMPLMKRSKGKKRKTSKRKKTDPMALLQQMMAKSASTTPQRSMNPLQYSNAMGQLQQNAANPRSAALTSAQYKALLSQVQSKANATSTRQKKSKNVCSKCASKMHKTVKHVSKKKTSK